MPRKIVVVDDDPVIRALLTELLAPFYEMHQAEDGSAGLDMIRQVVPDLAILDICMPKMHGFELCRHIRQDERLKGVKILVVSSKSYASDIKTAKESVGVDDYLVKPFDMEILLSKVKQMVGA